MKKFHVFFKSWPVAFGLVVAISISVAFAPAQAVVSYPILRPSDGLNDYRLQMPPEVVAFRYVFGDLDGDGDLDPVVKAIYPKDSEWEYYKVEAYRDDGTRLWSHDTNFLNHKGTGDYVHELNLVWDLDATGGAIQATDGKWEVVYNYKQSDGAWGLRVVDGATGNIRADVPWPGPTNGRAGQHRGTIAYLDGQKPSIIVNDGGEYNTGRIYAFDKNLNKLWDYSPGSSYGAHMIIAYDLDRDGKDEVIVGGTVLNGNGTKRWSMLDKGYGYMDLVQPGDHRPGNGMSEIYYLPTETPRGSGRGENNPGKGYSNPIVVDQNGNTVWENTSVYFCDHNARGWAADVTGDGLAEFYAEDHTYDVCSDDGTIPKASYDNSGNVFDRGVDKGRVRDENGDGTYDFGRWDGATDLSGDGGEENMKWDNTGGEIVVSFGSGGSTPHRWGNRSYMVQYTSFASGYAPWMYTPRAAVLSGQLPPPPPPPPPVLNPAFKIGDRVEMNANLNVRESPSIRSTLLGTKAKGIPGTVTSGPVSADNYVWWKVKYDDVEGWSAEKYLIKSGGLPSPLPTPTPTPIPIPTPTPTPPSLSYSKVNIAPLAVATTNSEAVMWQQTADKAIDRVIDGWPGDYTREWATEDPIHVGGWLKLTWNTPVTVDEVVLYDRKSFIEQITAGHITFSDGSTIQTGTLIDNGPTSFKFPPKIITSLTFTIDEKRADSVDLGLMEMEVFKTTDVTFPPRPPTVPIPPILPVPPVLNPAFKIGDRVEMNANLNVRESPSIRSTLLGTKAKGIPGTVTSGPVSADNYVWWKVKYDDVEGWSAEKYLIKRDGLPLPPPIPIPTPTPTLAPTPVPAPIAKKSPGN